MLPCDYSEIIDYGDLNKSESRFLGYTYNSKTNKIDLHIGNINNSNNVDSIDDLVDILNDSKNSKKQIEELKNEIYHLKNSHKLLKNELDENIKKNKSKMGNTSLNSLGITSNEIDGPNRGLILAHGNLCVKNNDDIEPIINADGINQKYLPSILTELPKQVEALTERIEDEKNVSIPIGSGGSTVINNPKLIYKELPAKFYRDSENRVEKIEYYLNGYVEYTEKLIRDSKGKIVNIIREHIDKEIQTTKINRGSDGKVIGTEIVYENEEMGFEFGGMI